MAEIQTKDLTGAALDWAVAKASQPVYSNTALVAAVRGGYDGIGNFHEPFNPSTDWAQGGTLIERENISVGHQGHLGVPLDSLWYATNRGDACGFGQTPLIAAMRCYVAGKLGPTVEVPEEIAQ